MQRRVPVIVAAVIAAILLTAQSSIIGQNAPPPAPLLSPDTTAAYIDAAQRSLDYLPGQVLVKFKPGATPEGQQRALEVMRSRPSVDSLEWAGDVAIVRDPLQTDARILAEQLSSQPEVQYAEPNYLAHHLSVPNDTGFGPRQWNLQQLDMARAWDINPGGNPSVIIAIVDTGVTTVNETRTFATWNGSAIQIINVPFAVNPDLPASRLVSPIDFVTSLGTTVLDTDGHGTHVSSTAGEETNNALLDAGIAYKARIMPVKVCASYWDVQFAFSAAGGRGFVPSDSGGCPFSAVALGVRYAADNGAKVINLSLGGTSQSQAMLDALNYALGKGVFIAIAAGNDKEVGNPPNFPAVYAEQLAGVMAVGATNRSGNRAFYSNTGSYVEIAAPGGDSRDSDNAGSGFIWQSTILPSVSDQAFVLFPVFDRYAEVAFQGTSQATPHVSGLAALLFTQGFKTPAQIEQVIKKTAKLIGQPSSPGSARNDDVGFGLIQPRTALFGSGIKK